MNSAEIKVHLLKKIDSWLSSITNEILRKKVEDVVFVTGGAITSLLQNQTVNDYDVYLRSKTILLELASYYLKEFKSNSYKSIAYDKNLQALYVEPTKDGVRIVHPQKLNKPKKYRQRAIKKYQPKFITENAITLTQRIQLIIRFAGTPKQIHKNFDFIHCMNYWIRRGNYLKINKKAMLSLREKKLEYVGTKYPIATLARVSKFTERGWSISEDNMTRICRQINSLDLSSKQVIEDQASGLYNKISVEIIEGIKERKGIDINQAIKYGNDLNSNHGIEVAY